MINISNNSNISYKRSDQTAKPKLCYIFPEYNEKTADHFYHHYEFLDKLSKNLDIFLIVEKGIGEINFGNFKKIYIQKYKFLPLRFLESFLIILRARFLGYKNFYTHYCYIGGINAAIISRLFGGKSYYWHCEMIWEFKQSLLSKLGLNLSLKLSKFLVTGSESLKNGYVKHFNLNPDRIKVMPNWINLNRFHPNISSTKHQASSKILLFVHWLAERKGAHLLIPIVKALHFNQAKRSIKRSDQTSEAINLLIIGDGPLKEKLAKEIKENKLEDYIQVLGKIPNKELMKYYETADIFILPSFQEGFPRVLLEAMASGIPYVASDVGAVREISPKIAQDFIVTRENIEEFADKIAILLSDEEAYNRFRIEELEKVKEYSLEKVVDKFIDLMK